MQVIRVGALLPLHVAVALGLLLASLDLAISLVGSGPSTLHPMFAGLLPLSVLAHLTCWLALTATRKFEAGPLAIAVAGFLLPPASVLTLTGFVDLDAALAAAATRTGLLQIGVLCMIGLANAVLVYRILVAHSLPQGTLQFAARVSLAAPMAVLALAVGIWIQERSGPAADITKVAVLPPALAGIILVVQIWRATSVRAWIAGVYVLAIAALILPSQLAGETVADRPSAASRSFDGDGPPLVLFITVDTLRRDALSIYEAKAPASPAFEALAEDALVYDRAYTSAPWTLPSLASLHTALPEPVHGMNSQAPEMPAGIRTLAQQYFDAGYATAAIGSNPWLSLSGLSRGFEQTHFYPENRHPSVGARLLAGVLDSPLSVDLDTSELTDLALSWIQTQAGRPSFLWLHYFDPHSPYDPPSEFLPHGDGGLRAFDQPYRVMSGSWQTNHEDKVRIRDLYAAEVRYVDHSLGRLLDGLRELGLYDRSLIAITADHGEEFWDHDTGFHGHTFFDEMLRVPLLIKFPGRSHVGRIASPVTNASIGGAIIAASGLASHGWHAFFPELPLVDPDSAVPSPAIFSYGTEYFERRRSVVYDGHKLILHLDSHRRELYDLAQDPNERRDHAELEPERVREMVALLQEQEERSAAAREALRVAASADAVMSEELREQLEALGYVQ